MSAARTRAGGPEGDVPEARLLPAEARELAGDVDDLEHARGQITLANVLVQQALRQLNDNYANAEHLLEQASAAIVRKVGAAQHD